MSWDPPERELPKRPYRDSALLYAALAGVIVLLAWATGGSVSNALVVAGAFFVLATLWSWRRLRLRLREEQRRA